MFKKDIDLIKDVHARYTLPAPLLDAGGLVNPTIADYSISMAKAIPVTLEDGRVVKVPHKDQSDRYVKIMRPWSFIDPSYIILNPANGDPYIEQLPEKYSGFFSTVIMVSVFEHVDDPYKVSDALFQIIKPGGYLINSTPFIFPHHDTDDGWRYTPKTLQRIHERSGFQWLEGDFHIKINAGDGVGDTNPERYGQPQAIWASYALCRRPQC